MLEFEDLIEEPGFQELIEDEKVKPEVPQPQVTSSLGQKPTVVPMDIQMQGEYGRKYGMDFDPNMYLPTDMPDMNVLEGEKPVEEVKEKAHHDFFISDEARKAIDAGQAKQANIYQTKEQDVRIDPELLQPGATEYLMDKLSNESLLGKASILITGTILAGVHGGNPIDYYRDIYDANQQTIMGYRPNAVQDMATGFLGVAVDLPLFSGIGTVYNSGSKAAIKYATQSVSDHLVRAGMTRQLADNYAKNSIVQLNAMLQSGTVLGTHAGLNDVATQIAEGAELGDINWNQAMETGGHSFILGGAIGAWGVGANYIKNSRYMQRMIDGSLRGRMVEKGLMSASVGGEIGVFTYGEALLDGERRWHDVTGQDVANATAIILGLKSMHSRQRLPEGRGEFSASEIEAIRKHTKDLSKRDPLRSIVENDAVEKILADKEVPFSVKAKLADRAGVEMEMPIVSRVESKSRPDGRTEVRTYTSDGTLVQSEIFASQADGHRFISDVETGMAEMGKAMETAKLKPEYQVELDRRLERAGVEGGIANQQMLEAVMQVPSARTAEQRKLAAKFFDTYDQFKTEKTEVAEGETAEPIFNEKAPEVTKPVEKVVPQITEGLKQYTPEQIELKYEANDRLQTKISHEKNGIDKMLGDLQAIRESGDYKTARLSSKTIRNYFPETQGDSFRIKSEAELNAIEKRLTDAKTNIEAELSRRKDAGEPAVGEGKFILGRQGFETKEQLFKELDKFPTLEGTLPEVFDFDTMKAISEYEALREGSGKKTAQDMRAMADRVRQAKGALKPGPGELRSSIPFLPEAYDLGVEVVARALEGGATITEAVGKAIDVVRAQTYYTRMSQIEKDRFEKELLTSLRNKALKQSGSGQAFDQFFRDVSAGTKGFSEVTYDPVLSLDGAKHGDFVSNYNKHRGNFDEHITKSIPGHKEIQVATGKAVVDVLPNGGKVLDIGGSENSWAKAVTETSGGKVKSTTVDPNETMRQHSEKTPVEGNTYIEEPFMVGWEGREAWKPSEKFDVVHESMVFQFMSNKRRSQLEYVIDNVMRKDGLLMMEEKFVPKDMKDVNDPKSEWAKNEAQKDRFKEQYFEAGELKEKSREVLEGMHERMVPSKELEALLGEKFEHVFRYWDSGNFKGYAATNSLAKARAFQESMGAVGESVFSAEPVEFVKGGEGKPPKTPTQKGIDKGLARPVDKVVVNEYTALKDQIKTQATIAKDIEKFRKESQAEIQKLIGGADFRKNMGARTTKTIARRVAGMDPRDPNSVMATMDYIDRAIKDAKFREELAEMDKAYERLDKKTSPESMARKDPKTGQTVGKGIDPTYQDKLKKIRSDMSKKDWRTAQEEIGKIQEQIEGMNPGDPELFKLLDRIEELNFHGILNESSNPSLPYLKNRVADIESIRKQGRTLGNAKRMIESERRAANIQAAVDVLNAGKRKAQLDPEAAANIKTPTYQKVSRWFDWTDMDSWFTLWDKASRFDKTSSTFKSDLSRIMSEPYLEAERNEFMSKTEVQTRVNKKLDEIYGTKGSSSKLKAQLDKNTNDLHTITWKDAKGETQSLNMTMNQMYKRWMELQDPSLKPSLIKQGYFDQFGERTAKYDALEGNLSPEARKWAEWQLNEFFPEYWETINEVYRDIYGTDMPFNDRYSPIFVADKLMDVNTAIDQMFQTNDIRGMAGNNHLKLRTGHAKELLLMDGDKVLTNYIDKMEFFKHWSHALRDMNSVANNRAVRESLRQNFGKDYVNTADFFLDKFARTPETMHKFEKASNNVRKNFTLGSLALRPTVFTKQLTSFPAFADKIPVKDFTLGLTDFATKPQEVLRILNDSPWIKERYAKGWDRDVVLAMQRDANSMLAKGGNSFKNSMMFLTKYGDKAAIVFGGWPVYKYYKNQGIEKGMTPEAAHEMAIREFEFAARQSQQDPSVAGLSKLQQGNPIMKWATMYKTSPIQYHRKVMTATRDLVFDGRNRKESLKTLLIYHGLLPQMFQLVSNGFQWDGEDQLRALKWGNFAAVPIVGDAVEGVANHFSNRGFGYSPTVATDLYDGTVKGLEEILEMAQQEGVWDDVANASFDEVWEAIDKLSKSAGSWTGTPADAVHNTVSGVSDLMNGETDYPVRRILGWSEFALDNDRYDLLRDLPDDIIDLIGKNMDNPNESWEELMEELDNPVLFEDVEKKDKRTSDEFEDLIEE